MIIKKTRSLGGRDYYAIMECEDCGALGKDKCGYSDAFYYNHVIPAMKCGGCGKSTNSITGVDDHKNVSSVTLPVVESEDL